MFRLIRFFITSCFIIGICSLSVNNRPLFHYVYKYSKIVVDPLQQSTQHLLKVSYHRTIHLSRQFFNNNLPVSDSLEYQISAPQREEHEYSDNDKKKLDNIFQK